MCLAGAGKRLLDLLLSTAIDSKVGKEELGLPTPFVTAWKGQIELDATIPPRPVETCQGSMVAVVHERELIAKLLERSPLVAPVRLESAPVN
jgi:hypothetical protein